MLLDIGKRKTIALTSDSLCLTTKQGIFPLLSPYYTLIITDLYNKNKKGGFDYGNMDCCIVSVSHHYFTRFHGSYLEK